MVEAADKEASSGGEESPDDDTAEDRYLNENDLEEGYLELNQASLRALFEDPKPKNFWQ